MHTWTNLWVIIYRTYSVNFLNSSTPIPSDIFFFTLVAWVLIGTVVIIVTIPAVAPTHQSASWVFTEFTNNTGYSSNAIVFFIGMLRMYYWSTLKLSDCYYANSKCLKIEAGWALVGYETGAQIVEVCTRLSYSVASSFCSSTNLHNVYYRVLKTRQPLHLAVSSFVSLVLFFRALHLFFPLSFRFKM